MGMSSIGNTIGNTIGNSIDNMGANSATGQGQAIGQSLADFARQAPGQLIGGAFNSPIYGQNSPFQPQQNTGGFNPSGMTMFQGPSSSSPVSMDYHEPLTYYKDTQGNIFDAQGNKTQDPYANFFGSGGMFGGKGGFGGGLGNQPLFFNGQGGNPMLGGPGQLPEPYQPNPLQGAPITPPNRGQLAGGPAGKPIVGPGQQMPLPMMQDGGSVGQQPMPLPMMQDGGSVGQQPMPVGRPLQGTLPGTNIPYAIGNEPITPPNRGQLAGGPAGRPIMGGGLKPQPRNYRAPVRSGGILRQRLR